jgi:LuxR family transcriptional regulator, maltose regulon positive regulatory protein
VTLVCAPAGWGKTVMLSEWRRAQDGKAPVLWYDADLDGGNVADRELWRRIVADLTKHEVIGRDVDESGEDTTSIPRGGAETGVVVVIDDFDRVAGPDLLSGIGYLVRAHRTRVRLVLGCRTPPLLPWHRWRVTGELGEIRADQLAFTLGETEQLIAAHGLDLPEATVGELHGLSEGWPAGLRLAAMTLRENPDPVHALSELGVDDLVANYLGEEVLTPMAPDTRQLLAEMSVAEQVTANMVEAVTGRIDGARLLAELDQQSSFVTRRPGPGGWYRFHPLLSRLLYAQLRREDPVGVIVAHRRVAGWYIAHGPPAEALRHLLAAEDWDAAITTVERHWPDIAVDARRRSLTELAPAPPDTIAADPRLALAFAAERLDAADPARARRYLRFAARGEPDPMRLALGLAEARLTGDLEKVVELGGALLSGLGDPDDPEAADRESRTFGLITVGRARLQLGDLTEAGRQLCEGLRLAGQTDLGAAQVSAGGHVALWYAARGRLHAAMRVGQDTLALAERLGLTRALDLGWVRVALAEVYYQWDRLGEAQRMAGEAIDYAHGDSQMLVSALLLQARVWSAAGRLCEAHETLLHARQEAAGGRVVGPLHRALGLVDAELRLAGGDLAAARRVLDGGPGDDPLTPWAAAISAALLLAEGKAAAAAATVAPYLGEDSPSLTWRAQAALLNALAGKVLGDRARVARGLDVALEAAEEEGFRRMFVAGGHPLRELIVAVAPTMGVYRLVATDLVRPAEGAVGASEPGWLGSSMTPNKVWTGGALVEPLTERELTVLRYLQGDLSNVEIASILYVSVNTIKTHVKNIYRKLNAVRRRDAVQRGRELRLL